MKNDIKLLEEELRTTLGDYNLSYTEDECFYALKKYIDGRFAILEDKLNSVKTSDTCYCPSCRPSCRFQEYQ